MAQTYDSENLRLMRSPAKVGIRLYVGTTMIMEFDNSNLISVNLSLRSVETKLDNPELQVSTIEIQAYYDGDMSDILRLRGKNSVIQYKSSYGSTLWANDVLSQYVGVRAFYTSFTDDNVKVKDHIITIKGTDWTGVISGYQIWNYTYLTPSWQSYTYNGTSYYKLDDMIATYMRWCVPTNKIPSLPSNYTPGYNFYYAKNYNDYIYRWAGPEANWRKRVAYLVNIFRGSATDKSVPRMLYVDAGAPHFHCNSSPIGTGSTGRIINNQNYNISNGVYNNVWYNGVWNLDYKDVADFDIEYGNAISKVTIDTPYCNTEDLTKQIVIRPNMSDIIKFDEPGKFVRYTVTAVGSASTLPSTHSLTQLSPTVAVFKCGSFSGACYIEVTYKKWIAIYNNSSSSSVPDISHNTGITNGDEIKLECTPFMRGIVGKLVPVSSGTVKDYNNFWHALAVKCACQESAAAQPRWIKFKWRGHPGMQPRDIILFTEKDGSKNYYEVDYLTLDHENGGLVSEVKAMYKQPYSS